ncbi:MAG TPA: hypothetical protein VMU83_21805 [Hanamia sp.]|nr:hypothetical protein [Hanamia sp.]
MSFILKVLSVQKMPGFPRGLETIKNLAPNINIIAGPNASGKSSTARIIQQVIWRSHVNSIQVESSFKINDESWEIKIDSGSIVLQRDGIDAELIGLPAFEESGRYMLALHELVEEEDGQLARQIVKESIGGYDLEKAGERLGYSGNIKNRGASQFKAFEYAAGACKDIQQKQSELKKEENKLGELNKTMQQAKDAAGLQDLYEQVIQYLEAKLQNDQSLEEYTAFPAVLDNVTGEEYQTMEDLEEEIRVADIAILDAGEKIRENEAAISQLKLPGGGCGEKVLAELEKRVEHLVETESEIQETEKKAGEFKVKEREALKSIDENLDASEWQQINLKDVNGLDKFLEEAHRTISQKQFFQTAISELQKEENDKGPKIELLVEGIRTLSYWLLEKGGISVVAKWWLLVISLTGILTVITTYYIGWPGLLGIALIIIGTIYALNAKTGNSKHIRKNDFDKTGLDGPEVWNTDGVSGKLQELMDTLQEANWQKKIRQKITFFTNDKEALQEQLKAINEKRDRWLEKIRAIPELPENNLKNYSGLSWFVHYVKEWQKNNAETRALEETKAWLSQDVTATIKMINELFPETISEKATDAITAKVILKQLSQDERARQNAVAETEHQNEFIHEKNLFKNKTAQKIQAIYNKLDREFGKKEEIHQLVEQLENYRNAKEKHQVAEKLLSEKMLQMRNHSLFESHQKEIESLTLDQAKEKSKDLSLLAQQFDSTNKEIIQIETNIQREKNGNDLEKALEVREDALEDLEQLYKDNLASNTGKLLIDQLKNEIGEQNLPQVFKRANELLIHITKGRYELKLDERDPPAFRAYDTIAKLGQDLSELSTGTRIQLLLSVRLAFIETQEAILKLPILADELLANSDDIRANAIIEALVEISREGRQIFYFTAQADEVSKWKNYLNTTQNISYEIIELTGSQNEMTGYKVNEVGFSSFELIQNIPSGEGKSHEEYGKLLNVTAFNPLTEEKEHLHLWYLLEDKELLRNCLTKGIKYYGQLDSFIRHNGKIEELNKVTLVSIQNKTMFLQRFLELYRIGRSRPIDRDILQHSGAVSYKFIEAVTEKLKDLEWNPRKLVMALNKGEVSGFRKNKAEELEEYLTAEGYFDKEEAFSIEIILVQLHAYLSNLELDPSEAESFINRILNWQSLHLNN